ncbi:putative lipopolysaccharide heptosyltransferase III [Tatumella saanichensis]|uniref:putative lipopolysaccharide heptosyltransferase III n=1 Tax=Tatumella saanichensis TaxID=480813 RepID=UPI0004A3DBB6|nr:putative lipopolysaccharide heptosyltransferase III [Tatumella saanichensis]
MSHRPPSEATPQRILIIKLRHHGDMLLMTPVISTLHDNYPDAHIDVLQYKETEPMLINHPLVNQCYCIDRAWKKLGPWRHIGHEWHLLRTLRAQRYDLVINLADQWRSALLTRFTGAPVRLGFDFPKRQSVAWKFCHSQLVPVTDHNALHTVEQNLSILAPLALPKISTRAAMHYLPSDAQCIRQRLDEGCVRGHYIVIHPSSRWFFKCWPEEKMAELITALTTAGYSIVLTSGPDKAEKAMVSRIRSLSQGETIISLAGEMTLPQLAALIDKADLFIGVDSVPMHMAAALNTPYVALFGPSKLTFWHPWEGQGEVIWAGDFGPLPDPDSIDTNTSERYLQRIPVEAVLSSVQRLLK